MYLVGVIASLLLVPLAADKCGRKLPFSLTIIVSLFSQAGMIWSHALLETYAYEFLLGLTFGGRIIVGFSYVLEYCPPEFHEYITVMVLVTESVGTICIALWYRYVDHAWLNVHIVLFVFSCLTGLFYIFFVPESPKWCMANGKYGRARESIKYIAAFNGQPKRV